MNRAIDASFDLKFQMNNAKLTLTVENIKWNNPSCFGSQYNPIATSIHINNAICSEDLSSGMYRFIDNQSQYFNKVIMTTIANVYFSN